MNDNQAVFCVQCGNKLPVKGKFCSSCGKPLHALNKKVPKSNKLFHQRGKYLVSIGISVAWVILSTYIISASSIERVADNCYPTFLRPDCEAKDYTIFNVSVLSIIAVLSLAMVIFYALRKLNRDIRLSNITSRITFVVIVGLIAIASSVLVAYTQERNNDHLILNAVEQDCMKNSDFHDYIHEGTFNCGSRVDRILEDRSHLDLLFGSYDRDNELPYQVLIFGMYSIITVFTLRPPKAINVSETKFH